MLLSNFVRIGLLGLFLSLGQVYAQQITAIAPASGQQGQTLTVYITGNGTGFQSTGTINKLWLNKGANNIVMTSLIVDIQFPRMIYPLFGPTSYVHQLEGPNPLTNSIPSSR